MFQLIHGYFTATRTDSVAYASFRKRLEAMVENRNSRPETAYGDTIQVTMAQHHPRARPWSESMLQELDLQKSMEVFRERFADAADFTFFLVGNMDLEEMAPLVERYLASLPALDRGETWRDIGMNPPAGVVTRTVRRGLEPKASTRIIFSGPFDFDNRLDRLQIGLMAEAFQIKLREVLREDLGGTYGVGVGARPAKFPTGNYSFGCDPERVEELTAAVFEQIDSLQTVGLDSSSTGKVREIRRREREVNLKENGWWLSLLEWVDKNQVEPLLILDNTVAENFSPADVLRAARWFDTTNYARFVMLPAEHPPATEP
ncbi:MAG: insulinase family protein [bacterium]|nr:insulinase family protein [bacterium]